LGQPCTVKIYYGYDYIVEKGFNAGFIAMDFMKAVLDLVATLNSDMFTDTSDVAKP
jgi:hypothetical protein